MKERFPNTPLHEDDGPGLTRRAALCGVLASLGVVLTVDKLGNGELSEQERSPEKIVSSERFESITGGYMAWWKLRSDELLLVDAATGAPVGKPFPHQDFEVDKNDKLSPCDPEKPTDCYLLTPAEPRSWNRKALASHAAENNVDADQLAQRNVNATFDAARNNAAEPALQEKIKAGEVATPLQIVEHFGSKPVRGVEDHSRISYVYESLQFESAMSEGVQRELRSLIPALLAKESTYNDAVTSKSGAGGITQFMPATVAGLKGYEQYVGERQKIEVNEAGEELAVTDDEGNPVLEQYVKQIPFIQQVEMLGKHFDNINREFHSEGIPALLEEHIVPCFPDRESYERDFLVPCMVNAYNPGAGTMRRALKELVNAAAVGETGGRDMFVRLSQFAAESKEGLLANYGPQSFAYTYHVYALRNLFREQGWIPKETSPA